MEGFNKEQKHSQFGKSARKRLRQYLNNWLDTIRLSRSLLHKKELKTLSKYTFVTLTLPSAQRHCDKVIKREILNAFLIELKRDFNVNNYLWKAEPQTNGNIHFHLITSKYIDAIELRLIWLFHCERLGYVSEFREKHRSFLPNATDIHALKSIRDVTAYVSKYMSKSTPVRPICGVTYGCSDSLRKLVNMNISIESKTGENFKVLRDSTSWSLFQTSHASVYNLTSHWNLNLLGEHAMNEIKSILESNLVHISDG